MNTFILQPEFNRLKHYIKVVCCESHCESKWGCLLVSRRTEIGSTGVSVFSMEGTNAIQAFQVSNINRRQPLDSRILVHCHGL